MICKRTVPRDGGGGDLLATICDHVKISGQVVDASQTVAARDCIWLIVEVVSLVPNREGMDPSVGMPGIYPR